MKRMVFKPLEEFFTGILYYQTMFPYIKLPSRIVK
jgi:hypothetical protein